MGSPAGCTIWAVTWRAGVSARVARRRRAPKSGTKQSGASQGMPRPPANPPQVRAMMGLHPERSSRVWPAPGDRMRPFAGEPRRRPHARSRVVNTPQGTNGRAER